MVLRRLSVCACLAVLCAAIAFAEVREQCPARVDVNWIAASQSDNEELDRWCGAVGPPLYVQVPATSIDIEPPAIEDLVIVTWNAHLAAGRLDALIEQLRAGALTEGRAVPHFVVFAQELFRRDEVPLNLAANARTARSIRIGDTDAPDVRDYAIKLGVSILYVPAVRNGIDVTEDRGNAIIASEPLRQPLAFELPIERQRRIAVGAAIDVMHDGRRSTLRVINAHLENLSSARSLWVFRNPRKRQMEALLDMVSSSRFEDDAAWMGTIVGGDLNTIHDGEHESVYRRARAWGNSLVSEDRRATHLMGRLDYLLFRLAPGLGARTMRVEEKFGSDHHPVIGVFTKIRE